MTADLSDIVDDPTIQLSMVTSLSNKNANFAQYDDPKI
jgi:hypothetical protein